MPTQCFLLVPTNRARRYLRRYKTVAVDDDVRRNCPLPHGYHDASTFIDDIEVEIDAQGNWKGPDGDEHLLRFVGDPRWPAACECGYRFAEEDGPSRTGDERQVFLDRIYRQAEPIVRPDLPLEMSIREAPVGAIWDAHWYPDEWKGPDGRALMCRVPTNHDWCIDGRASNCPKPEDKTHKCWIRHGEPPYLTVDKNGASCAAGGGSIQAAEWHGFLRNGILEP